MLDFTSVTVKDCTLNKTNPPLENECPVPLFEYLCSSAKSGLYFRSKNISGLLGFALFVKKKKLEKNEFAR